MDLMLASAEVAEEAINAGPYVGVIGQLIMWTGLIVVLAMFKGFVVQGLSLAMAEFLVRNTSEEVQEKVCRWLVNSDQVEAYLKQIKEKS